MICLKDDYQHGWIFSDKNFEIQTKLWKEFQIVKGVGKKGIWGNLVRAPDVGRGIDQE